MHSSLFRRIVWYGCLTALVAMMLFSLGGCGGKKTESSYGPAAEWVDDMREQIQKDIDDPEKVAALLVVVDNIEITLVDLDENVKTYYKTLTELDKNYNTTREEFQAAIDTFNAMRKEIFEKLLEQMAEMKRIAGEEDWKKIADIDTTLYESWQRSYEL